jgi:phosphoribosylformimino-5-aminoimidazole carboxamide ribonucleotide (ProFAR) isomerase
MPHIDAVFRAVSSQFGESKIVSLDCQQAKIFVAAWEDLGQSRFILLRQIRDSNVIQIERSAAC